MASAPLSVQFGLRVRELREAAGISQEAFANKFGFARSYMSKIERGQSNVALDAVKRLADALGVEPKTLFEPPASITTRPKRGKAKVLVPFAADGTCFNPTLRQPRAGTFVVGEKTHEQRFENFEDALRYLREMPIAKWRRPNPGGNLGIVSAERWDELPDQYCQFTN